MIAFVCTIFYVQFFRYIAIVCNYSILGVQLKPDYCKMTMFNLLDKIKNQAKLCGVVIEAAGHKTR